MMEDNTTTPALPEPRFAVGAAVTVKATGRKGTVVYNARRDGEWRPMVDQPHGHGILRQHYSEDELQ